MPILDRQRNAFTNKLGPASEKLGMPALMYQYLGSLGYLQACLLERLAAWGIVNNIPQSLRLTKLGLIAEDPPGPVGPLNILVPGDLSGTVIPYTNVNGVVHLRVAAIKTGTGASTVTVNVDATPMTFIAKDEETAVGSAFVAAFYITGLAAASHNITVTVTGATLGNAAVRLGELVSQTGIGNIGTSIQSNPTYYTEVDVNAQVNGTSQMGSVVCYNNDAAHDIYPSFSDTEQWATSQTGMAARFATGTSPSGEGGGLFVYYSRSGGNYNSAAIVYEILGAVLP